jgi:predicted ATPase
MIRLIEALNFRCLRYVKTRLGPFHVLVGPNASGKTTFLDALAFLGKMVADGPEAAVSERTPNPSDLLWSQKGKHFELAIEVGIPPEKKSLLKRDYSSLRYEVQLGFDDLTNEFGILEERALLKPDGIDPPQQRTLFPIEIEPPESILTGKAKPGCRTVFSKSRSGNDNFYSEVDEESGKGWYPSIRLGHRKSALSSVHEDETRFPITLWLKRLLSEGVQTLVLNSLQLRRASPPGKGRGFRPDGSNLPWVIAELRERQLSRFNDWIKHLQTALPDLNDIQTFEREDDKHRYLKIAYRGGLKVPSWMTSDGTLRLLALTLPAYLPGLKGIFLIEEPENGIHPSATEAVCQSLSSVYDAQVLMATHSTVILSQAQASKVLCFKKTPSGATDIVLGSEHPQLKSWKGQPNLSILFASGVLG